MLYYAIGDSLSWLWVIQNDRSDHFFLPPRHELASRIRAIRVGLSDPSRAGDRSVLGASHQLYRKLIEPALPLLKGVSDLIVVPHGELARVPFEALLSLPPGDAGPVSGSYLIDRWAVSYLPSATTLARIPAPGTEEAVVTVVFRGTPGPRIAPLPDAASEIEALSSLTHQRSYLALTGADATRARLLALPKQIGADLLHLAAPGVMDDLEPDRSGWWLAPDSSEGAPSFLHLRDLTGLNLAAGQITVSACESGRDRFDRGDGALGLARGLLSAGARGVMVSQWRVSDRSTAILMERFYTKILKEGVSRSQALADAKRELLHRAETRSPYFWAAFVLVGDPGPLERAIVR
jgi:CHAT domain-containing protein